MPYRQPAERSGEDAPRKRRTPVEALFVSRFGVVPARILVAGAAVLAGFLSWNAYAKIRIACTRASAGAAPFCTVTVNGPSARTTEPFELRDGSLEVVERSSDDTTSSALRTPAGEIDRGVTQAFAKNAVADAKRFLARPEETSWVAENTRSGAAIGVAAAGIVFVGVLVVLARRKHLVIDREAGVVRVGARTDGAHAFGDVLAAQVEEVDDGSSHRLVLLKRRDVRVVAAAGRAPEVRAAALAINRALAERFESKRAMPTELRDALRDDDELERLDDAGRTRWLEQFLRELPIDDLAIEHDESRGRIEARGTKRGLPIRLSYATRWPSRTEIAITARGGLGHLDLSWEEGDADISMRDPEAEAAFERLPFGLQLRIREGMRRWSVATFRIRPDETTLDSLDGPRDVRDPVAHASALIELAAEAAEASANAVGA